MSSANINQLNKNEFTSKSTQGQSLSNVPPAIQKEDQPLSSQNKEVLYSINNNAKDQEAKSNNLQAKGNGEFRMDHHKFSLGVPCFLRIFYLQTTKLMSLINKNVIKKGKKMDIIHIPDLEERQTVQHSYGIMEEQLDKITKGGEIKGSHIYQMVTYLFRKEFILSHIIIALSLVIKAFNSMIIQQIINSVVDDEKEQAIFWVIMLFILLLINIILSNNSFNYIQSMANNIRANLIAFLYTKASRLTSFQIQKASIGKLFNLISYDLSTFEILTYFAFMLVYIPLLLIVSGVILYFRFGGYGLLSILIIFMIVPIQLYMGIKSKKFTSFKNKYSDERIKLINESIDGIRLIKMYGWEEAFRRYIQDIRIKEQDSIRSIQLRRAADRGLSMAIVILATFIPILVIQYKGAEEITSSKIFATLEQIYSLRAILFLSGMGIGFLFQLSLILNRFADFLKLKKQSMSLLTQNPNHNPQLFEKQLKLKLKKEQLEKKKMMHLKENPGDAMNRKVLAQFQLSKEEEDEVKTENNKFNQNQYTISTPMNDQNVIELSNFSSFWEINNPPTLKNVTLEIKKGLHYGLVGKVGSGKSTFLQVLLDEVPHLQGDFRKQGSFAFVEQEPYVFSGKFKDNILFGKPYEMDFYNQVIEACCLIQDLEQLPNGDETEIGERGVNLSGGQKARLSLARAVYSRSDIYLLDDPLSAVDAKVARKLNQNCINGLLKNKTVILVTHQIHFTKSCDQVVIFDDGKISHVGKFEELTGALSEISNQKIFGENEDIQSQNEKQKEVEEDGEKGQVKEEKKKETLPQEQQVQLAQQKAKKGQLFIQEKEEKFELSFKTYKNYLTAINSKLGIFIVALLYLSTEGLYTAFYYVFGSYDDSDDKDQLFYVSGILVICFIVGCVVKYVMTVLLAVRASNNLHNKMFKAITRSPQLYFDQTPSGRILTKFTNDMGIIDMFLPFMIFDSIEQPLQFINVCITVGVFNPWFFILAAVIAYVSSYLLKNNKTLIVQSKQVDMMYKSPVNQLFMKTIQGIIHIRIYKQVEDFLKQMFKSVNNSMRTNYCVWGFNRAFQFNQQFVTSIFSAGGIILCVYTVDDSSKIGQSIVYLTMLVEIINAISRQIPNIENSMTSVERILQICNLPEEDPLTLSTDNTLYKHQKSAIYKIQNDPSATNAHIVKKQNLSWVNEGSIEYKNVQMRYRKDLDLVLKGTSFSIKGGERIGCIGRTGAGKSSILQALFRMVPYEEGSLITIDGSDIKKMGLHTLRSSISIIPQIPFVFSGSIRRNLDPLEEYTDAQVWQALKQTDLEETVKKLPHNILTDMSNAQSVFSTGQKQLICLARAILKNSKILVLDEATANVDMRTDEFIQNAIKQQFQQSTIFTIAHRLNTIADYDKVIVMDQGIVTEYDEPYKLLVSKLGDEEITSNSVFAQMVKNTGKENSQHILNIAKAKFYQKN